MKQKIFVITLLILFSLVYGKWVFMPQIIAGDWPYYTEKMLQNYTIFAPLWTSQGGIGLGGVNPAFPIFGYLYFTAGLFVNFLHLPWVLVYKITWFTLPLILGVVAIVYLYKGITQKAALWEVTLSSFLYLCNTYFLMITGGGQMGIALSYSVAPFIIGAVIRFINNLDKKTSYKDMLRSGILLGLFVSIQILFDPRIAFITVGLGMLYAVYNLFFIKPQVIYKIIFYWIIMFILTALLHSYWIVPFYLFKLLDLPKGITASNGFAFFSFADFAHAFSFLHPNWPDNVFGKVYFLQPEFLFYPFIAFLGLVLFQRFSTQIKRIYIFLSVSALIGIFLAKGVNDPFGGINNWLFNFIPGFNLFRDPTKWYLLIALSYSLMIPLTFTTINMMLKKYKIGHTFSVLIFLVIIVFPLRDAFEGKLKGTFSYTPIPNDYLKLPDFLDSQPTFFRTLWVPDQSPFRFISENHPMLLAQDVFGTSSSSGILKKLQQASEEKYLENLAVKYIVVPDDTTGEIFVTDSKYDNSKRNDFIQQLDTVAYLKKQRIGKIVLYKVSHPENHFYFENGKTISYNKYSSSQYMLSFSSLTTQTLIFSESYHPGWIAVENGKEIKSIETKDGLNSFNLPKGIYSLQIIFKPQEYQKYFYMISGFSLMGILLFLLLTRNKEN